MKLETLKLQKKIEELEYELKINNEKNTLLNDDNNNFKNNLEKKRKKIEELRNEIEENNNINQNKLNELLDKIKLKDDEISKNKAKYDYDLAILNEKAK